jgi:uncharacterized protein YndB with AHSA1/START domain
MKKHTHAPIRLAIFAATVALTVAGCGPRLSTLNALAQEGKVNERSPDVAHLEIEIDAPPAKVWSLLTNASQWPQWDKQIASVTAPGPFSTAGTKFMWKSGDTEINSEVQLVEPQTRLAWTGTAMSAKAIHVWQLQSIPGDRTRVTMKESMDGPLISRLFPPDRLKEAGQQWLIALKKAAEVQAEGQH